VEGVNAIRLKRGNYVGVGGILVRGTRAGKPLAGPKGKDDSSMGLDILCRRTPGGHTKKRLTWETSWKKNTTLQKSE